MCIPLVRTKTSWNHTAHCHFINRTLLFQEILAWEDKNNFITYFKNLWNIHFSKIIDHAANLLGPLHTRSLCEIQPITGHSSRLPSKSHLVPPSLTILAWTLLSPSQGPSLSLPANETFTLNQTPNLLRILSFPAPLQYATKTLSG